MTEPKWVWYYSGTNRTRKGSDELKKINQYKTGGGCNMHETQILHVNDLMTLLDIGRDRAYKLMQSSDFPSTKLGKTYFITHESFYKWLQESSGKEIFIDK